MHAKAQNAFWEGGRDENTEEVEKTTFLYPSPMRSRKIVVGPINVEYRRYNPSHCIETQWMIMAVRIVLMRVFKPISGRGSLQESKHTECVMGSNVLKQYMNWAKDS